MTPLPTTTQLSSTPQNLRDLHGIPVQNGTVRAGILIRSDDICTISEDVATGLVERFQLSAIVDLRTPGELTATGRGPLAGLPVSYHHLPMGTSADIEDSSGIRSREDLSLWYAHVIESSAPQLVTAIALIGVQHGATLFHCAIGKDRTGMVAAALLSVLGASVTDIADDYARTAPALDAIFARFALSPANDVKTGGLNNLLTLEPRPAIVLAEHEAMADALHIIEARHGSMTKLLATAGLTRSHIDLLSARAIAPAS